MQYVETPTIHIQRPKESCTHVRKQKNKCMTENILFRELISELLFLFWYSWGTRKEPYMNETGANRQWTKFQGKETYINKISIISKVNKMSSHRCLLDLPVHQLVTKWLTDPGLQYRRGRVGRGFHPPPNTQNHNYSINKWCGVTISLRTGGQGHTTSINTLPNPMLTHTRSILTNSIIIARFHTFRLNHHGWTYGRTNGLTDRQTDGYSGYGRVGKDTVLT